ncbi:hypothetical protein HU200_061022 [Digitaria exilis]|uniref:Protein kinase domain-containing protein n=1 Tax=Digitaria exilis TaxID=1010633 RepID=A0A835DYD9_9POAL|nr:hypothetical protein HU200_061022 [Digitaria exilis]
MKEALVLLVFLISPVRARSTASSNLTVSLPGCPDKCGNISIPYPFGIGTDCAATSLNPFFALTCNDTFQPPRPMIIGNSSTPREVIDISLEHGKVRSYGPVSYSCFRANNTILENYTAEIILDGTPFIPSTTRNRLTAIGCSAMGVIGGSNPNPYVTGCFSYCQGINDTEDGAPCTGMGCCVCLSALVVVSLACFLVMKLQRIRHRKEKDEYFKQNGGLKLYDEMRSRQVDTILVLTEKDIKKATDNYSMDRVLGCGGRGMVYRGTLDNNEEVAIKKSKTIDDDCREEFVNEMIILSQINHRNIVRLLGCCLEVDVPMLVYEFITNGTLYDFLHNNDQTLPIPLDLRLKIATQSAEALAYIHSSTSRTILHGDVKSLNILLDNECNAKVSDFGASALKPLEKNDFIMLIQGTLGYLDPETFVSHHLTDKSDVYSFGVVLLELITRKRAIYMDDFNEQKSLSHTFVLMFQQNKLWDMLDSEIIDDEDMVVLEKLAELVMHCLSPRGDDRPTMKEVAERLLMLKRLQMQLATKTKPIRVRYSHGGPSGPVDSGEIRYHGMETTKLVFDVDS